jgi:hypothetical protein
MIEFWNKYKLYFILFMKGGEFSFKNKKNISSS